MKAIVLNEYGDSNHLKLEAASAQRLAEAGGISKILLKI